VGALQPTKNFKATYFVTDSDMKFYYNSSYKAHLNTINKLKDQGKWDA
jgi:cell division protein YceG involved in septum cleavage